MITNYFKVASRNMIKNKMYTAINISGFAIGLIAWIFILGYTHHEMSYDDFHKNKDHIYRIVRENLKGKGGFERGASGALGPALLKGVPEIEQAVRMLNRNRTWVSHLDKGFYLTFCLADKSFTDMFSVSFVKGTAKTWFNQPYAVIISQSTAHKFFGDKDPIGKTIRVGDRYYNGDYIVTGVFQDWPKNSSIQFDCLTATLSPKSIASWAWREWKPNDNWHPTEHFVMLDKNASFKAIRDKLQQTIITYMGHEAREMLNYHLQPLSRIHLYSGHDYNFTQGGNISQIYMLYIIGFIIMTLICINFVNFATALSYQRAKEIGMRKMVGAKRKQLTCQLLCEPLLLCLISFIIAWTLAGIFSFILSIGPNPNALYITFLRSLGITFLSGICGGIYPAILATRFSVIEVFRSNMPKSKWHFRKMLMTFQLTISIGMFIGTYIVYQQLTFMKQKELGFDKEAVLVMPIFQNSKKAQRSVAKQYPIIERVFKKHPNVMGASTSNHLPGLNLWQSTSTFHPINQLQNLFHMRTLVVTESFLEFYDIDLLEGRNFTPTEGMATGQTKQDHGEMIIINEAASKQLGFANTIGQKLQHGRFESEIIGVIKDFHIASLHKKLEPVVLTTARGNLRNLSLRIRTKNMPETMAFIEKTWKQFLPNRPFEYFFLDNEIEQAYDKEKQLENILNVAIVISLLITCIGLLGMISLSIEQRKKEIGIRKVLGASIYNLVILLSKDTFGHLLIANLIIWPITYHIMQHWLQNFTYHITIDLQPFVIACVSIAVMVFLTVCIQAIKAAQKNPIETVRYE